MKFIFSFSIAILLVLVPAAPVQAQRLLQTALPSHYALALSPDLKAATYTGEETIDLVLSAPSSAVTLNAIELKFASAELTAAGQTQTASISLDEKKEQATFTVPQPLPAGPAQLHIRFTGTLNNELRGFYLSKTAKRNYAVTQFESTDARRAFPSFDEPALKATYDLTLVIDAADKAIGNMPVVSDTPGPEAGKHTLKFATTPKMSTYLLAFLVGDFECQRGSSDGVDIGVCATPDKVALTGYALQEAKAYLHYYNQYFGIRFPLPKLDLIALPDFEAGAMENFGAITYRETALLTDPKTASLGTLEGVGTTIAHEMAHQWFGDLVTMQWWDNIWLNEGFASWMEAKPVAAQHPEWHLDEDEASGVDSTLNLDARPTTHAIRAQADSREEIEQMFDGISYGKGSAVLSMVENFLGPETFRQGVHAYLSAHLYGNATAEDFWNAQTATSHQPVDKIMESFIAQPGEPLITLGEPTADGKLPVSQRRFFRSPSVKPDPAQQWTIPVCFKNPTGRDCQILTPSTKFLNAAAHSAAFANAGGTGYYRTLYPASTLDKILATASTSLTAPERISLVGDLWAQVRANTTSIGSFLTLAGQLKNDPSPNVTDSALGGVASAYSRLTTNESERKALAQWLEVNYGPVYRALPAATATDSPTLRQRRALLFYDLGYIARDPKILAEAKQLTGKYLTDQGSVDATLARNALSLASSSGDAALFDRLQKIAETSSNPELQQAALFQLSGFENPALLERALDYAVSGKVRNQDALRLVASALYSDENRDRTWAYVKSHWDKIRPQLTPEMGGGLVSATSSFCTAAERDDVEKFFASHPVPSADRSLKRAVESIDSCIEFRQLQGPNLKAWLATEAK
jgi:aminopeptidase N/puromycin-sensitive aminopeptidase